MTRKRPLTQDYEQYTAEDFIVWNTLYKRQMNLLERYACRDYLDAITKVGFHKAAIPNFKDLNTILLKQTGWQLVVVPAIVPQQEFFSLLAKKIFPATCWLRSLEELDYIEEPDMFHDVFGHVPLLAQPDYAKFMQSFGALATQWAYEPELLSLLGKIYWFTIEFGLVAENGIFKIYGAGIISSPGETRNSMTATTKRTALTTKSIINIDYRTDTLQERYFYIHRLAQLHDILPQLRQLMECLHHVN